MSPVICWKWMFLCFASTIIAYGRCQSFSTVSSGANSGVLTGPNTPSGGLANLQQMYIAQLTTPGPHTVRLTYDWNLFDALGHLECYDNLYFPDLNQTMCGQSQGTMDLWIPGSSFNFSFHSQSYAFLSEFSIAYTVLQATTVSFHTSVPTTERNTTDSPPATQAMDDTTDLSDTTETSANFVSTSDIDDTIFTTSTSISATEETGTTPTAENVFTSERTTSEPAVQETSETTQNTGELTSNNNNNVISSTDHVPSDDGSTTAAIEQTRETTASSPPSSSLPSQPITYSREQHPCSCIRTKASPSWNDPEEEGVKRNEMARRIKSSLTVSAANVSATRRRYICARDDRLTSAVMAVVIAVVAFLPILLIVVSDSVRFARTIYRSYYVSRQDRAHSSSSPSSSFAQTA